MTRYCMVIDQRKCIGCHSCTVACRTWNDLPVDTIYNPVITEGVQGIFPTVHLTYKPLLCQHCDQPPCVPCCPTGASHQDEDGIVWVDPNKCMCCKVCVQACPYGARMQSHYEGFVRKCTFCKPRVEQGLQPNCVNTCHQKARIFGDLDDPDSQVSKLVNGTYTERSMVELGTRPQIYYIPDLGGQS